MKLSELKENEKAKIMRIDFSKRKTDRYAQFGIIEGSELVLVRKAPFNDPIEIRVKDVYVAIRKSDAGKIWVVKG